MLSLLFLSDFDKGLVRNLRQAPSHVDWHAGHNQANHDNLNQYVVKRRAQLKDRSQNTDEEPILHRRRTLAAQRRDAVKHNMGVDASVGDNGSGD